MMLATGFFASAVSTNTAHATECQNDAGGTAPTTAPTDGGSAESTACGSGADASGGGASTAYGNNANSSGGAPSGNVAVGNGASSLSTDGTATLNVSVGSSANANGDDSSANTSIGGGSNSSGDGSVNAALGTSADASGDNSLNTALGSNAVATGDGTQNVAVGAGSTATGVNSAAFGSGSFASNANSAAFGNGATTTRDNQQVFGTATSTHTMSGVASAASAAAQGAPTRIVTSNDAGDLAAQTFAELGIGSAADVSVLQSQVNTLGNRDKELADGIAIALALEQPILVGQQKFALRGGYGNFDGESALGLSATALVSRSTFGPGTSVMLDAGIGYGTNTDTVAGRAGVTIGW